MLGAAPWKRMVLRDVQPLKALAAMEVTLPAMVAVVSLVQPISAFSDTAVTPCSIARVTGSPRGPEVMAPLP